MNVVTPLIADGEPSVVVEPGESALCHPPVPTQLLATLHSLASDTARNPPRAKSLSASRYVIRFVSVPLVRTLARSSRSTVRATNRLNVVHHLLEDPRVVGVGTSQFHREGYAPSFDHKMALRARFALICGVRPNSLCLRVPFFTPFARTVSESREARDQSILSASPGRSSSAQCNLRHTPRCCQSRSLRQQVTALPQPISWSSISHGGPLRSTKMMPQSAARSGNRGRPSLGLGGSCGKSGSIVFHSSSGTRGLLMPICYRKSQTRF